MYTLSNLANVCRFWRVTLIKKPRAWATIFATQRDRRSFVSTCLERSYPAPLEVTVDVHIYGQTDPSCTCDIDEDGDGFLVHNETVPCESHFVFESLAETKHSTRIHTLNVVFYSDREGDLLELEGCRFFKLSDLKPTSLRLEMSGKNHAPLRPYFPPTLLFMFPLRSSVGDGFTKFKNLTSFTFVSSGKGISVEGFQDLLLNNRSLETLSLDSVDFETDSNQDPVTLPNLKSLSVNYPLDGSEEQYSAVFRAPALQRLSSLLISVTEGKSEFDRFTLSATGEDIAFTIECDLEWIVELWQDLTEYASPTIHHIRLGTPGNLDDLFDVEGDGGVITLFADAHTVEIGRCVCFDHRFAYTHPGFWNDMKELGPQLKTIRFEIPEDAEPVEGSGEDGDVGHNALFYHIKDLVIYRFTHNRPFSSVERMVVSDNEQVNRRQESVWRRFYGDCHLDGYIRHHR